MKQYICDTYIISIYSIKAIFNYFIITKLQKSNNNNITFINKQIQLQLDNKLYKVYFKVVNLSITKLFVFIDRFFTNNKDQSFILALLLPLRISIYSKI